MAERRMFAKSIVSSGRFLRMPPSSRLLYYDLGMYADDDGIVEAFSVMRQTQATEDDLRVLVSKGFVKVLNDELLAYITDWKVNNFIRSDRYHPSIHKDLLLQLTDGCTDGIPNDNQWSTEVRLGKDSIGKDRLGKDRLDNNVHLKPKELREEFETLWSIYPKKQGGKDKAYGYYERARRAGTTYEEVGQGIAAYREYIEANGIEMQFVKMGTTFFSQKAWTDDWTIRNRRQRGINAVFAEIFEEHQDDV